MTVRQLRLWVAAALPVAVLTSLLAASATPAFAAGSTSLVVSEVYGGGGNSGATYTNDFIELQNVGSTTIDVSGYSVQYSSAAGTSFQTTALSGRIPPGATYLVQEAAGRAVRRLFPPLTKVAVSP